MRATVEELFKSGGPLAAADPHFEERPQQAAMAAAVWAAFENGESLVVEAPTGVGKSLAYLLPGALWAASSGRRVLVSTQTKTLQEQLVGRELPLVEEVMRRLGLPLRSALLMGAENYLCVQRLERAASQPGLFDGAAGRTVSELLDWSASAGSGLRSGLPSLVGEGLWARLRREPDLCLGSTGRSWPRCLYRRDREAAERSHILVVNHALLLSGARLPSHDALVIDEAHALEETAVSHFGLSVASGRAARLLSDIRGGPHERGPLLGRVRGCSEPIRRSAASAADAASLSLKEFFRELADSHGLPQALAAVADEPQSRPLQPRTFSPAIALKELEAALEAVAAACPDAEESAEARAMALRLTHIRAQAVSILEGSQPGTARWVEATRHGIELRGAPLDVAERLAQTVFTGSVPAVLTSATLGSGDGLGEFRRRVGLEGARGVVLDSPFDFRSQAALLVLEDLPEPDQEGRFDAAVAAACRRIIAAVPGGILILFSSWKSLRRVHERLKSRVRGRPVWAQGRSGNEALIGDFGRARNAVLLGVDTFWHGVDVEGGALSCVVVAKLPFPNFSSPLEGARREFLEEKGRNYFKDWSVPRAVAKFRQGFGRLIRSSSDRGAVVVLDSRLARRSYGAQFLEALPPCRRLDSTAELKAFFQGKATAPRSGTS